MEKASSVIRCPEMPKSFAGGVCRAGAEDPSC